MGIEIADDLAEAGAAWVEMCSMPRRLPGARSALPEGSRILEVSPKCLPTEAFQAAAETSTYLHVADALQGCRSLDPTPGGEPRLDLSGLAPTGAPGPTRQARGRPS